MKHKLLLLSILSGFLFWLSWPVMPLGFLLHVVFVPLLLIEDELSVEPVKRKGWKFFGYAYLSLLIWNIATTWWVYNASAAGGVFAMFANAMLMCIPLILFYYTKKAAGNLAGYFSFVVYWLAFEYIHLNWDLTWPWLTLGNGFASIPQIVQWYEYTGHLGGSFWVLVGNLLLFTTIRFGQIAKAPLSVFGLWFGFPVMLSLVMYFTYEDEGKPVEVVVVQPNIDPFEEKFEDGSRFIPYEEQFQRLVDLTEQKITPNTKFVAWPETALPFGYFEHELMDYPMIQQLFEFAEKHPQITLITGLDTYKVYFNNPTPTSRYNPGVGFYDAFNTAIKIDSTSKYVLYHKSKLVPGVEYVPPYIKSLAIDLGGVVGGLGCEDFRTVFFSPDSIGAAPVICYESVFGEYITEYVREGADFIAIITNDGWWGNTPGHRQHLHYARLRAIETRRSVARSANTGISGFINQRGDILETSKYCEAAALRDNIYANEKETFFVKFGDYVGMSGIFFSIICMVIMFGGIFGIVKRAKIKK